MQSVAWVMRGLNYCEALQRQYGHKLEGDSNHIQSQHKSVTPNNLSASSAKSQRALNLNSDTLKRFKDKHLDMANKIKSKDLNMRSVCTGSNH